MTIASTGELLTPEGIFASYQCIRRLLPQVTTLPAATQTIPDLTPLEDHYDVFVFDAFGVLNVGDKAIVGAVERLHRLQRLGKHVFVLTNGAGLTREETAQKFLRLGFQVESTHILSSRDALLAELPAYPAIKTWGAILPEDAATNELPPGTLLPDDPGFFSADGFLFLSAQEWDTDWHQHWVEQLREKPRPVLLGTPDLVAPYEESYKLQPGYFCLQITPDYLHPWVRPFGKPFPEVFSRVKQQLNRVWHSDAPPRVLMVGDTLHTDVLGGAAAGFDTALVTDHGAHKGMPLARCYKESGIVPVWQIPGI